MASKNFIVVFGLLAASAAVVFIGLSIDHEVYAPGAHEFGATVHLQALRGHVPHRFDGDLTPRRILRKIYSIGAFAIVGFFAAAMLDEKRRGVGCMLLVACFSAIIEIVQKVTGSHESLLSNAFDIGCGALGGLIGAGLWTACFRAYKALRPR